MKEVFGKRRSLLPETELSGLCSNPPVHPKPKPSAGHGFGLEKAEQGSEGSFRQKAKPGAGNGAERTLLRRHPQSAVSIGIICFFRLMTLGRKMWLSLGWTLKACWIISSLPE